MRARLTYPNVMSTIAVFLALGLGGAYAADKITSKDLAKSAVTSKVIKDKAVKGKDVRDKTLTGPDYRDGSVGSADIADGGVAAIDLAAAAPPIRPTLGNGAENDCLWIDGIEDFPGTAPASYRMNAFGEVSLDGIAFAVDGPGGDVTCDGVAAEGVEDSTIFVLEPEYRPANTEIFFTSGSGTIFIAGVNGLNLFGLLQLPPGAVVGESQDPAALNEIHYLAAVAPNSPAPTKAPARISRAELRALER